MKIIPLVVGIAKREKTTYVMGATPKLIDLPFIMFLAHAPNATVLIDSGVRDPEESPWFHKPYQQPQCQKVENVLAGVGLKPDDIDIVIHTHLHWDHCANNRLFPRAKFYVQREELRYAAAPLYVHAKYYDAFELGFIPPFVGTKFEVIDGDREITEGVSVLLTPGHTPGFQSVVLSWDDCSCIIAGDNLPLCENLQGDGPGGFIPSTIYVDLETYYCSMFRILGLGLPIIPGHDISLIGKEELLG